MRRILLQIRMARIKKDTSPKIRVIRYSFSPQLAYQIRDFVLFPTKAPCIR